MFVTQLRCRFHPRRRPAYVVDGWLVCWECGAEAGRVVPPSAIVPLPAPLLIRTADDDQVHIAEERVRDVGNVARCGRVMAVGQTIAGDNWRGLALCPACGAVLAFSEAANMQAQWQASVVARVRPAQPSQAMAKLRPE